MELKIKHSPTTGIKRFIGRTFYFFIPDRIKKGVEEKFFQPSPNDKILDKIIRWHTDGRFALLSESDRDKFCQSFWQNEAGTNWIETKRAKYKKGEMDFFLKNVRAPFERMIVGFLKNNKNFKTILEIGTGCGQFCFDLFDKLGRGYSFIGIDLNSKAIAKNIKFAKDLGISDKVHFECIEISKWLEAQKEFDDILLLSVATFKFFTRTQLMQVLNLIRNKCRFAAIALCEEVSANFHKSEDSEYSGTLGFSHNYPTILNKLGYRIKDTTIINLDAKRAEICIIASF